MAEPEDIYISIDMQGELRLQCRRCCRFLATNSVIINTVEELNSVVFEHKCKGISE